LSILGAMTTQGASDLARQTIAGVLVRMQQDLERPWNLDEMARLAGYDVYHFAHVFRSVVGFPPRHYVRRLRLERAAHELVNDAERPIAAIADAAGYTSTEAFTRAFRRAFSMPPTAFRDAALEQAALPSEAPVAHAQWVDEVPVGLEPSARVVALGPLSGWTVVVQSFDDLAVVQQALGALVAAKPPDGPWQLGGLSQPWGWDRAHDPARELRCLLLTDDPAPPPPPILRWRMPRGWFASFEYQGALDGVVAACTWIMSQWVPRSDLRAAFAPLVSLMGGVLDDGRSHLRLYAPVRELHH
jgi:AraC family transcriptional regulator